MAETINCGSCGAPNQLPEGRTSMFCAFCGKGIEKKIVKSVVNELESNIRFKPEISYDELSMIDRGINSISEVISWYSDSELNTIRYLNLSNNNISSLKGLEKFKNLSILNFENNKISSIGSTNNATIFGSLYSISFSGNRFTSLDNDDICVINKIHMTKNLIINFTKNPFNDYEWIDKIDYDKILNTYIAPQRFEPVNYDSSIFKSKDIPYDKKKDNYLYDDVSVVILTDNGKIIRYHPRSKNANKEVGNLNSKDSNTQVSNTEKPTAFIYLLFALFTIGGVFALFNDKTFLGLSCIIFFGGGGLLTYIKNSKN